MTITSQQSLRVDRKRFFQAFWKKNKLVTFVCLLAFSHLAAQTQPEPFVVKHAHAIRIVCLLELLILTGNKTVHTALLDQAQPTKLIKNFAREYGSHVLVTFFHELGHALAAKVINDDPISVHVGSNNPTSKPLVTFSGVSINGFHPNQGYSLYTRFAGYDKAITAKFTELLLAHCTEQEINLRELSLEQRNKLTHEISASSDFIDFMQELEQQHQRKTAIIMLAGGSLGITAHVALKTVTNMISQVLHHKNLSCFKAFTKALQPDAIMLHQILNMVIPFQTEAEQHSDGKIVLECCKVSPALIHGLQKLSPVIDRLIDISMSVKDSSETIEGHSKLLLGLLNHELRGFLRLQC